MRLIDITENAYLKLKYIKDNYKLVLSKIFDEKDQATNLTYDSNWPKNKYVKLFLNLLLSLFAYQISETEVIANNSNTKAFYLSHFPLLKENLPKRDFLIHAYAASSLIILIFYAFT
jgi:alanine-alpha-ketoisovalerate/valine-pyruvate aminotransferase